MINEEFVGGEMGEAARLEMEKQGINPDYEQAMADRASGKIIVGTRVKIKDGYKPYKSVWGLSGTIIWSGKVDGRPLYQIQTDVTPRRLGRNTCFAFAEEFEILSV